MNNAVMFSKASDEWSTPDDFWAELHQEFEFGLDAAATYENSKCLRYLSDALDVSWGDIDPIVWLNPPYSKCREFIAKAALEASKGCTVVCLVPSRTDTRWFHDYVWDREKHQPRPGVELRFVRGRIKFGTPDGSLVRKGHSNSAPFPSVVIVFRPVNS